MDPGATVVVEMGDTGVPVVEIADVPDVVVAAMVVVPVVARISKSIAES